VKFVFYKSRRIQKFRLAIAGQRDYRKRLCVVRQQEAPIARPVFDPMPFIVTIDFLWLLTSDFNLLDQEWRIRSTVRKKIERNEARVWRPYGV
jgi:hypothetical protein